jgi:D-alanyl-D-alanine carboxypeptidase/D-alanyl-D-alanine-endopeptidase (penicillin-binding protein 4)
VIAALFFARHAEPQPAPSAAADARVPELEAAVRAIVHDGVFKEAKVAIAIVDVDSGRYLASTNEHLPLNPASNAKIYTAAAALAMLRAEHRYETTLSGTLKKDAVAGSLVLKGHGDPSLSTADLAAMVSELRNYGVHRVDGDVLVDQIFFDEQTTPPAFEQQPNEWSYFRAPVSAVALNENCVILTIRPASGAGGTAQATFEPPGYVDVEGSIRTGEKGADNVTVTLAGKGQRMAAKIGGTVSEGSRVVRFTKRAEDPTLMAGFALKALLERAEIKVSGDVKAGKDSGHVIVRHQSAPLSALLYPVGKNSDNFYAEMIFKTLGGEAKTRPAKSADAAQAVTEWLDKIGANDKGVVIKNGSGLFDSNRVTAHSAAMLLRYVWRDATIQPEFLSQLSVGGIDGTLHKRFRMDTTRRRVRAKTGTLDDVIALSGYVLGPPGKGPIAFSMFFNKVAGHADGARAAADKLVELIARRQWAGH